MHPCRDSYNAEVGRGLMSQGAEGNAMWKSKLLNGEGCYTCLARPLLSLSFRRAVGGGRGGGHELLRSNRWTGDRTTTTGWWTLSATLASRKLLPPNVDSAFQPFISSLLFLKVLFLTESACLPSVSSACNCKDSDEHQSRCNMDILYGYVIRTYYMDLLYGSIIRIYYTDVSYGYIIRTYYMDILYGHI